MAPETQQDAQFLCIRCRNVGHHLTDCDQEPQTNIPQKSHDILATLKSDAPLCDRCCQLWPYLISLIVGKEDPYITYTDPVGVYSLGSGMEAPFYSNCPLCRLIFSCLPMVPSLRHHEVPNIILYLASMLFQLGPEEAISATEPQRYLIPFVLPSITERKGPEWSMPIDYRGAEVLDKCKSFIVLSASDQTRQIPGRMLDIACFDTKVAMEWVHRCQSLHSTSCQARWSEDLRKIRLIDVKKRTIVNYPAEQSPVDYIALSYVWGAAKPAERYQLGSVVKVLPKTIEDAIQVTKKLCKEFLWVDSLCIDQGDPADKQNQIRYMASIYSGAWLTLVALSGEDGNSGLARSGACTDIGKSKERAFSQWTCSSGSTSLITVPHTLSYQIRKSKWATRGWTLQEAVLSPRCLYFADEQTYFECNRHQSCEALENSGSQLHSANETRPEDGHLPYDKEKVCFKNLLQINSPAHPNDPVRFYEFLVVNYTARFLSNEADILSAFSAILTEFERTRKWSFAWGLPRHLFSSHLMWELGPYDKTNDLTRRSGFPSWSWLGWKRRLSHFASGFRSRKLYSQIYEFVGGQRVALDTSPPDVEKLQSERAEDLRDKLLRTSKTHATELPVAAEMEGYVLVVDGVICKLNLKHYTPFYFNFDDGSDLSEGEEVWDCWLVADDEFSGYNFLVLQWDKGIARRVGVFAEKSEGFDDLDTKSRLETFWLA